MAFLVQKLIYTINISLNFVSGSFFEQDHLLNFDCQRGPLQRILSEKKYRGVGLISVKTNILYAELNKRAEVATSSYSVTCHSLQYIYSVPVSKNHWNI